jgi:transketolase
LNVKIAATHAGISVGEDGATHQCNEDIALMRTIPGMTILCPSDDVEAKAAIRVAAAYVGPVYIRLGRAAVPIINNYPGYKFEMGKGNCLRKGSDITIVATGIMVYAALEAAKKLELNGVSAEVINIHTIKPFDEKIIIDSVKKTGRVVTCEEHSVIGGLGSAVCDCLSTNYPALVYKLGMQDQFGESGPAAELLKKYGFDSDGVFKAVTKILS